MGNGYSLIIAFLLTGTLSQFVYSETDKVLCESNLTGMRSAESVFSDLQKLPLNGEALLVSQFPFNKHILPTGGGACATATAFNLLQGMVAYSGEQEPLDPTPFIEQLFCDLPYLKEGRVTNSQFSAVLNHFKGIFKKHRIEIFLNVGDQIQIEDFHAAQNEFKVLIYQILSSNGERSGRHFIVLKKLLSDTSLAAVDPNDPRKETKFTIQNFEGSLYLVKTTDKVPWPPKFKMDAVFTVRILPLHLD